MLIKEIICAPFYALAFVGLSLTSLAGLGIYMVKGEHKKEEE